MISLRKINRHVVFISHDVIEYIEHSSSVSPETETGGIIGGRGSVENGTVIITNASDGGPKAARTAFRFSRDTEYCQTVVDAWAIKSKGEIDYLGEWHKHLERNPMPSVKDIDTMKHIAASPKYHVAISILLIIGKSNNRKSMRIFLINSNGETSEAKWRARL